MLGFLTRVLTMPPDGTMPDLAGAKYVFFVNDISHKSADPQLSGRDILRSAGFNPASEYVLIQIKTPGSHSVGLDETVDLTEDGREAFRAFASDRIYTFTIDERGYEWGARKITEAELRAVTGAAESKTFVLERAGEPDRIIDAGDEVDLGERGTEHIKTTKAFVTIIVEAEPHKWPKGEMISYAQVVTLAFPDYPQHPERTYSVTYRKGEGHHHEGILAPGDSVKVKDGMEFNVTDTGQS